MVNGRSSWNLVTFDLDLWPLELFSYFFSIQAKTCEWTDLTTSFSVWIYIVRISESTSSCLICNIYGHGHGGKNAGLRSPRTELNFSCESAAFGRNRNTLGGWGRNVRGRMPYVRVVQLFTALAVSGRRRDTNSNRPPADCRSLALLEAVAV